MAGVTDDAGAGRGGRPDRADPAGAADGVGGARSTAGVCTSWPARASRSSGRPVRSPCTASTSSRRAAGDPRRLRVEVECSSGTYVRTLAADLGHALGGGAHLRNLRRTAIGSFTLAEARPLADLLVTPMTEVMRDYPSVVVSSEVAVAVGFGKVLERAVLGVGRMPGRRAVGRARRAGRPAGGVRGPQGHHRQAVGRRRRLPLRASRLPLRARARPLSSLHRHAGAPRPRPARRTAGGDRHHHRRVRRRAPGPPRGHPPGASSSPPNGGCRPRSSPSTATRPAWCDPSRRRCCSPTSSRSSSCSPSTGVDYTLVVRFDEARSLEPAEEFVTEVLVRPPGGAGRRGRRRLPLRPPAQGQRRAAPGHGRRARLRRGGASSWSASTAAGPRARGSGVVDRDPRRAHRR